MLSLYVPTTSGVTTSYGYGSANDLLTTESVSGTTTQTIGYTADGRMASFSPGIQAPGGQYITSLSYNQDARLSAVNAAGGALARQVARSKAVSSRAKLVEAVPCSSRSLR